MQGIETMAERIPDPDVEQERCKQRRREAGHANREHCGDGNASGQKNRRGITWRYRKKKSEPTGDNVGEGQGCIDDQPALCPRVAEP